MPVSKTSTTEPHDVFDEALFQQLARGRWNAFKQNLILIGLGGVRNSWLACALGQKACRDGYSIFCKRIPRTFAELETGRADVRYARLFRALPRANFLTFDGWGPDRLNADQRRDLTEIVEDRDQSNSILSRSGKETATHCRYGVAACWLRGQDLDFVHFLRWAG